VTGGPLLLDLGNSRLRVADWEGPGKRGEVSERDLHWLEDASLDDWLAPHLDDGAREIFASSTHPAYWEEHLAPRLASFSVHLPGPDTFPFPVRSTGTGSDRILAGHAAWRRAGNPVLVADIGTAWTLDAVGKAGDFLGGAIGPGLAVLEQGLEVACPHLGEPAPSGTIPGIPDTTPASLRAGIHVALSCALEGLADRWEKDHGPFPGRFLTGGGAATIEEHMANAWKRADHLVLEGLSWIPGS
jgi:pantothenate kinase type III